MRDGDDGIECAGVEACANGRLLRADNV